jgi:UDP-2-acetamido-3-amino-2,3-dideoxy-glucuronate N-acetyltransferase
MPAVAPGRAISQVKISSNQKGRARAAEIPAARNVTVHNAQSQTLRLAMKSSRRRARSSALCIVTLPESGLRSADYHEGMIASDVAMGPGVAIAHPELVNLYGCRIGSGTRIGPFVEIQTGAAIGSNCKISSHSFVCSEVTLEDEVFVGHGVMFTNDRYPRAVTEDGRMQDAGDWSALPTLVRRRASIGSNATLLCGLTVGEEAMVAAGAVVTCDVPDFAIVAGVPARVVGDVRRNRRSG